MAWMSSQTISLPQILREDELMLAGRPAVTATERNQDVLAASAETGTISPKEEE